MDDNEKRILINQIRWKQGELKSSEDALRFWTRYRYLDNAAVYEKHYERQVQDCERQIEMLKRRLEGGGL